MNTERKNEILTRIGVWLDAWPDEEPLPAGLDPALVDEPSDPPDLAMLAGAVTACSREMEIQGKAFKGLREELREEMSGLAQRFDRLGSDSASPAHASIDVLLDLHERLARTVERGRKATAGLSRVGRWGGAGAELAAIVDGVALTLAHLTDQLERASVRSIETTGAVFDPGTMRAIEAVAADAATPAGTVAATLRPGYLRGDRVLRPAQVRVAR